jgi:hypothetical protein
MEPGIREVDAALEALRPGLAADGYALEVEDVAHGVARVRIVAGPEACAECLLPEPEMSAMLLAVLDELPAIRQVEVAYPAEES